MSGKRTAILLTLFRGLLLSIVITLIGMLTIAALAVFARISDSLLRFFNQCQHVPHTKDTASHTIWVEYF